MGQGGGDTQWGLVLGGGWEGGREGEGVGGGGEGGEGEG